MKRKLGSFYLISLSVALGLCMVSGVAWADNIAWDLVSSSSQNLVSYSTDAPDFGNPGDGFQKYTAIQQACPPPPDPNLNSIPYALVDDSACLYPTDLGGIIDSMTDFDEFFGICDTVNDVNSDPVNATWIFDISAGDSDFELHIDLAAMGNFEDPEDIYVWSYQVDSGAVQTILTAVADEGNTLTYTLAGGTVVDLSDPLVVDGVTLSNYFQTFSTPIPAGSQLTVVLTALTDGGYEGYAARNILVTATTDEPPPGGGGEPIPVLSMTGVAAMALLLMAGAVFLFRRLH
ncbi:MAG: hypothetical protein DRJ65_07065 [Acidobacteria bacterium]|nr:MAG: hypothetical protein DRJ65_07065 [Acidobacteriota bacterium]